MKNTIVLDVETYSEIDLRRVGAFRYAQDPSTEILCISWRTLGGHIGVWRPGDRIPEFALDVITHDFYLGAWNVKFDAEIYKELLHKKYGWPWPGYKKFVDIASCAAYAGLPHKLETAARIMHGPEKDVAGHRLMMKISKPARITKNLKDVKRHHTENNLHALAKYCKQDVKAEAYVADKLPLLSDYERAVERADHRMNARGVKIDTDFVDSAIWIAQQVQEDMRSELQEITGGAIVDENQRDAIVTFLNAQGMEVDSIAKDILVEHMKQDIPQVCRRVIEIRQALAKSSLAKYQKLRESVCTDGRVRGVLMYYGAHTGRWAGRLVQVQNLPRGNIKKKDLDFVRNLVLTRNFEMLDILYGEGLLSILSALIRTAFVAGEGRELHVSDYSSIEARVAFWFCQDRTGLDIYYKRGGRLYEETAAAIYRVPVGQVTSHQRQFGKVIALACQYGVGEKTILTQCESYGIEGITEAMAREAKDAYRAKFGRVVKTWYQLEDACKEACSNYYQKYKVGGCIIRHNSKHLQIKLPSGRVLYYRDAHLRMKVTPWGAEKMQVHYYGEDSQTKRYVLQSTYGGKLLENIVQAIARDILAEAFVRAEKRGLHPVFMVHDELVLDEKIGTFSCSQLDELMAVQPSWAPGLPISAEGWSGDYYRKD